MYSTRTDARTGSSLMSPQRNILEHEARGVLQTSVGAAVSLVDRYTARAAAYSRCRWDYTEEAVEAFTRECGLPKDATIADIGSGTGMVTRQFVDRVRIVFAVEPNAEMRGLATDSLRAHRAYQEVDGFSDATTLPGRSVRLITVGRALHWFPAESTRAEFYRILEPGGCLASFSVKCTNTGLLDALKALRIPENGWDPAVDKNQRHVVPLNFYFGHDRFRTLTFARSVRETWDVFLGRMYSLVSAPTPDHPRRLNFERTLREVFDEHADDGVLDIPNETHIAFAQMCRQR